MANNQYDVSEEMLRLFKLKQKQRAEAKSYFQRFVTNPHRPIGDAGPFDPVAFRLMALDPYQIEQFKPSPRNFLLFAGAGLLPIFALYKWVTYSSAKTEAKYRSGQVAYKDRMFKLVY